MLLFSTITMHQYAPSIHDSLPRRALFPPCTSSYTYSRSLAVDGPPSFAHRLSQLVRVPCLSSLPCTYCTFKEVRRNDDTIVLPIWILLHLHLAFRWIQGLRLYMCHARPTRVVSLQATCRDEILKGNLASLRHGLFGLADKDSRVVELLVWLVTGRARKRMRSVKVTATFPLLNLATHAPSGLPTCVLR